VSFLGFINLHVHTEYSLLDGMCKIKDLVKEAKNRNDTSVAITDHGVMHGYIKFYKECIKNDIKPIIGMEAYVCKNRTVKEKRVLGDYSHLLLLAKNEEGLKNLIKITSDASQVGFYRRPRTDINFLRDHGNGIIATSACRAGEIPSLLMYEHDTIISWINNKSQKKTELIYVLTKNEVEKKKEDFREKYPRKKFPQYCYLKNIRKKLRIKSKIAEAIVLTEAYKKIFDEFYLEIEASDTEEQKTLNKKIVELARATETPLVATNDSHYIYKEDAQTHEVLLAIQTNGRLSDPNRFKFDSSCYWLKNEEETREYLQLSNIPKEAIEEAIANTIKISSQCNVDIAFNEIKFPVIDVPEGKSIYEHLEDEAYKGLQSFVSEFDLDSAIYKKRLDYELGVVKEAKIDAYFLIVQDIYKHAREKNIPCGPGRGSASGALLSRVLGITMVDPIKHNLSFERFYCPGRIGYPDIDMDFCPYRRKELFQYIIDKYGIERCAHIGTFGTLNPRMLIRDIGRALDIPFEIADKIAKSIPEMITDDDSGDRISINIDNSLAESTELAEYEKEYPYLFEVARKLEGMPRHTSVHAAGIIVSPMPLLEEMPLMRNKAPEDPLPITMLDMGDVEDLGFLKLDFLGVDALTIIDNCIEATYLRNVKKIDLLKIPLDDQKVYKNIKELKNLGVFQIGTNIGKRMTSKIQPSNFSELVDILALARPGPMQSGQDQEYIMHKIGIKPVEYIHEKLKPILETTYGQIVYQEQLMAITRKLAGFDHTGADKLRKSIGKKDMELLASLKNSFVSGCLEQETLTEEQAITLWDQMEKFGGYCFNLSHAVSYAYLTYWMSWLKTYQPVEFMAAILTNEYSKSGPDKDAKIVEALLECRNMNIQILQPNINESSDKFEVVGCKRIRFPISGIKGVGQKAVDSILEGSPYYSLEDFFERVPKRNCNKRVVQSLILAGVFDLFNPNRLITLRQYFDLRGEEPDLEVKVDRKNKISLPKDSINYEFWQMLEWEQILLGNYISGHPLDTIESDTWRNKSPGNRITVVGKIYNHRNINIRKGKYEGRTMSLVDMNTKEGNLTVVLFADQHDKFHNKIKKNNVIKVVGKFDLRDGAPQIVASMVTVPKIKTG